MDDVYAINLAKTILREGFGKADTEGILSIYDDEFADMSFGMPSFYYSDAKDILRARLNRIFQDYFASMKVIIIDVVLNGDKALDWGWHVLDLVSKESGEKLQVRTRYFETWRRDAVRGWLVTSFIDNLDQPPRMPEDAIDAVTAGDDYSPLARLASDLPKFAVQGRS
jgi:hypothetical protein